MEVVGRAASSATYYATNTHGYGYAGIQMSNKHAKFGDRVICSTWDQGSGEDQRAKMEECGEGVSCVGFGGEGTGAKALWYWQWTLGKTYAWMLHRKQLANGRIEHTCWFHAEELESTYL